MDSHEIVRRIQRLESILNSRRNRFARPKLVEPEPEVIPQPEARAAVDQAQTPEQDGDGKTQPGEIGARPEWLPRG